MDELLDHTLPFLSSFLPFRFSRNSDVCHMCVVREEGGGRECCMHINGRLFVLSHHHYSPSSSLLPVMAALGRLFRLFHYCAFFFLFFHGLFWTLTEWLFMAPFSPSSLLFTLHPLPRQAARQALSLHKETCTPSHTYAV
jgi:hypothetical protein